MIIKFDTEKQEKIFNFSFIFCHLQNLGNFFFYLLVFVSRKTLRKVSGKKKKLYFDIFCMLEFETGCTPLLTFSSYQNI